jgi:CMP/dCMP kinase
MIISISGVAGSGKSTVAKILMQKLNAERVYVGGIRRVLAKSKDMTIEELNEYAKTHPETDVDVDKLAVERVRSLDKQGKNVIVEGRTMFHFLPESIKIYVKVDPDEGARRVWKDLQENPEERNQAKVSGLEELKVKTHERDLKDAERYLKYYGINHLDESHYDLVIDSTHIPAQEVAEKIIGFVEKISY